MQLASPDRTLAKALRLRAAELAVLRSSGAELRALDEALVRALSKVGLQRLRRALGETHLVDLKPGDPLPISAVFIRPVGDRCNLACAYCYQAHLREEAHGKRMSFDTLRATLEAASKLPTRPISFAWHGGEPLLAGKAFFRRAFDLLAHYFPVKGEVTNSVQTSGVLLDDEWLQMFKDARFAVGISLDGPAELHDALRVTKSGAGTYTTVVDMTVRAKTLEVPLNAICVIGERHQGQELRVFEAFRALGIEHCNLQPDFGTDDTGVPTHVSAVTFANFMRGFWDLWLNAPAPHMRIRFFDNFLLEILEGGGDDCVFSGECSRLIAVSEAGELRPCSRPIQAYAQMGRIELLPSSGAGDSNFERFRAEDVSAQRRASSCRFFSMCHQGCPQHRVGAAGRQAVGGRNVFCGCSNSKGAGYDTIWSHMLRDIERDLGGSLQEVPLGG